MAKPKTARPQTDHPGPITKPDENAPKDGNPGDDQQKNKPGQGARRGDQGGKHERTSGDHGRAR